MSPEATMRLSLRGLFQASARALLVVVFAGTACRKEPEVGGQRVFKLREVSVFDECKESFIRGQMCRCQDKPLPEVTSYPDFISKFPVYGSLRVGGRFDDTNSGVLFCFALDERQGTGKGYDLLYLDANRDLDLRNDAVAKPQRRSPDRGYKPNFSGVRAVTAFEFVKLDLSTNAADHSPVELMPRLLITGSDEKTHQFVFFVRTHIHEGSIKLGTERFRVTLGNDYVVTPTLHSPGTALHLSGEHGSFDWWGADRLSAIQKVDGRFYTLSASSSGDQLTVCPYAGELGTFEVGAGGRNLTNLTVSGSLEAREWAVPVGGEIKDGRPARARECQIPVGDYLPTFVRIGFGRLEIELSQDYHSEGKSMDRRGRSPIYGVSIRKDKPFVLDFSNQPDVMFASPATDQRIKLGEELRVKAVLVDAKLDIMIRDLDDTTRKQTKDANGKALSYERNLSLDPNVLITRANGEKVAEGVMPFG